MVTTSLLAALLALLAWTALAFNRLVRRGNLVREAWSGIDVQLERRHDLDVLRDAARDGDATGYHPAWFSGSAFDGLGATGFASALSSSLSSSIASSSTAPGSSSGSSGGGSSGGGGGGGGGGW
jgi:uncharacterized membrane protein YgcG